MPRRNGLSTSKATAAKSRQTVKLGNRSIGNAKLLHIDANHLLRNASLAYEDGYADGREYGRNGKFIPDYFTAEDRVRYLTGFAAGVRVNDVRKERFGI